MREDPRCRWSRWSAAFKAGLLAETPENNGITQALLSRVSIKGTKTRTAEQIANQIEVGGRQPSPPIPGTIP